jgi:hypothetical protein
MGVSSLAVRRETKDVLTETSVPTSLITLSCNPVDYNFEP